MGFRSRIAEEASSLREKVAKIASTHRQEKKARVHGPGIFSRMPNSNVPADIELPPMDLDFAFDFEIEGKGKFFLRDGDWCIRGEDVMYVDERRKTKRDNERNRSTCQPRTMCDIDKPKPADLRDLTKHASEDGWDLPANHERHLLNFPQEILNNILRHILVLQGPGFLGPNFRSCKADTKVPIFEYHLFGGEALPTTTHISRTDAIGPYYEVRVVHRSAIDATVLRTCKKFYNQGIDLLYSNKFSFFTRSGWSITQTHISQAEEIVPTLASLPNNTQQRAFLELLERDMYRSNYRRDHMTNSFRVCWGRPIIIVHLPFRIPITRWIGFSINGINISRPHLRSRERLHWDCFLWFLWIIGPENASRIKSMRFHSHDSNESLQIFKCYLLYINYFCAGLENLRIDAGWRAIFDPSDAASRSLHPRTLALKDLLKQEIRGIQSLRGLEVFDVPCRWDPEEDEESCGWHELTGPKTVPKYAKSTISWVKKRRSEIDRGKFLEQVSHDICKAHREGDTSRVNVGMELLRWESERKKVR